MKGPDHLIYDVVETAPGMDSKWGGLDSCQFLISGALPPFY